MPAYICKTCGVQYPPAALPPQSCPICEDERQYVGWNGQQWTTLAELQREGRRNTLIEEEPALTSIGTTPSFAIGQRALLVQTPTGNVLWDCISYIDAESIEAVRRLGGVQAICISHPHFYAAMIEWSDAFAGAPIHIPCVDERWVMRRSPALNLWDGDALTVLPGLTLLRLGGHFEGSTVLHWPDGQNGRGVLLSGDTVTVVPDRRYVSFMYSYPNLIPLSQATVQRMVNQLRPYPFARIYGAWNGRVVSTDGFAAVERSAERYSAAQRER